MRDNGNINVSGNRRKPTRGTWGDVTKELGGFTIAEVASEGVWLGVAAATTMIPDRFMDCATKVIGHTIVEPVLEPLEKLINKICKLEECKIDPTQPREKRAEHLARAIIVFTPAFAAGTLVKLWVRAKTQSGHRKDDRLLAPAANLITIADEGTLIGAMYLLNNPLASQSDSMIRSVTGMSQKLFGWSEKRAHEFASTMVVWALPNAVGMLGATGAIIGKHLNGWPEGNPVLKKIFVDWLGPHSKQ